ncbi:hypothetical protein O181_077516 [Austropuccinia psidii MF-1]|uniref:Uncharacterized protein n=1 Tax=Austropuccinia psidii MF-1 TaxID=1389203 RepID=A0A9Q3FI85_9BASI|nr:hypothetical protein [Austropuccinia psidii MF-1]
MPAQAPDASHANPYVVQVPDNLSVFLCRCRLPIIHIQILMLVQASNNSHENPDACEGSQQFKQFLTPVQASDNSHANPSTCEGSQKFKQLNT